MAKKKQQEGVAGAGGAYSAPGHVLRLTQARAEGLAEALIRLMNRRFTLSASDLQKVRTVRDLSKLRQA